MKCSAEWLSGTEFTWLHAAVCLHTGRESWYSISNDDSCKNCILVESCSKWLWQYLYHGHCAFQMLSHYFLKTYSTHTHMHVYVWVVLRNCTQIYMWYGALRRICAPDVLLWMCVSSLGHCATYPAEENKSSWDFKNNNIYKHLTNMTSTPFQLKIRNPKECTWSIKTGWIDEIRHWFFSFFLKAFPVLIFRGGNGFSIFWGFAIGSCTNAQKQNKWHVNISVVYYERVNHKPDGACSILFLHTHRRDIKRRSLLVSLT